MTFTFIVSVKQLSLSYQFLPVFKTSCGYHIALLKVELGTFPSKPSSSLYNLKVPPSHTLPRTLNFLHPKLPYPITAQTQLIALLQYFHMDPLPPTPLLILESHPLPPTSANEIIWPILPNLTIHAIPFLIFKTMIFPESKRKSVHTAPLFKSLSDVQEKLVFKLFTIAISLKWDTNSQMLDFSHSSFCLMNSLQPLNHYSQLVFTFYLRDYFLWEATFGVLQPQMD